MKQGSVYIRKGFLFLFFSISSTFIFSQQYIVNSEWAFSYFSNDTSNYFYKKAVVKVDASNNVYTLGSCITATGHDFLLMKQNSLGDTLFMTNWNGDADGEDIAMDMWIDNNNEHVYIVGGSIQNATDSLDPVIVQLNDTGAIVNYSYSGNATSNNDTYISVTSDGSNYIYAAGTINNSGYDFLITQFDFSATETNQDIYDYVGYDDVAIKVVYSSGALIIAGISEPTDSTWDYYIREYKGNALALADEYRNYAGSGVTHRPTDAVFRDNYYYITGAIYNGVDYDIKTVKLDTTLSIVWEQTWDGSLNDISRSIKVDGDGNVYLTGSTDASLSNSNLLTIKYDNNGNEKWFRTYDWNNEHLNDVGHDLELLDDNVYITGYIRNGSNYNTICYDSAGTSRWQRISEIGTTYPMDMAIDSEGNVIIGGPLIYGLYTEKFQTLKLCDTAVFHDSLMVDSGYVEHFFLADELVVQFNPEMINTSAIDNSGIYFGKPSTFLTPTAVTAIEDKTGLILDKDVTLIKIFKRLKTTDTMSVSRDSLLIQNEKMWSYLRFKFSPSLDIFSIEDSLETMDSVVFNVEVNPFAEAQTNDPLFSNQTSLHFANSDTTINVEGAWNFETGKEHIRVGFVDHPIYSGHEDFIDSGLNFTAIKGGWDYWNNQDFYNISFPASLDAVTYKWNHGTAMAGLVGALRNNSTGIAGIAGGDIANGDKGVSLYSLRIFRVMPNTISWRNLALSTDIADALMEGGSFVNGGFENGGYGYGLHVLNNSWRIIDIEYVGDADIADYDTASNINQIDIKIIRDAVYHSWRNGTVIASARGNFFGSINTYPACYYDEMGMSVGGTGVDGKYLHMLGEGPYNGFPGEGLKCAYKNIDFVAPATAIMNMSTTYDASSYGFLCGGTYYDCVNGTSTSTALVSGVSALMLSQQNSSQTINNQNLCNEDVEHVIENYATDISDYPPYTYFSGQPDFYNGWGRVNASNVMEHLDYPMYQIFHSGVFSSSFGNPIATNMSLIVPEHIGVVIPTMYVADKWEVVQHYTNVFSPSTELLGYWPRLHGTFGFSHANPVVNYPYVEMDLNWNDTTGTATITMTTYVYHITAYSLGALDLWLPCPPSQVKTPYSLHIYDPMNNSVNEVADMNRVKLYPNPTNNNSILNIYSVQDCKTRITIIDIYGKVISSQPYHIIQGENNMNIDCFNLPGGIYFIKFEIGLKTYNLKLIKTTRE